MNSEIKVTEKQSKGKGGAREGAGRKKGEPNKRTAALVALVESTGITPLDYMLAVMRDPKADMRRRDLAAAAAAPYVHSKLASVEHKGPGGGPIEITQITRKIVRPEK